MSVSGHLLLLFIPVLSLCGATKYYVRPTELTNTSCPAQPCLTLSQYINDSDHYFQSNTVFKFLPGTHHMDRPLHFGDVHNVSMEGLTDSNDNPHLVAQFACEKLTANNCVHIDVKISLAKLDMCCTALHVNNVYNASFKGIDIIVKSPGISGAVFANVSTIHILNVAVFLHFPTPRYNLSIGILFYEAYQVELYSSTAKGFSCGLELLSTNNSRIMNTTTMFNWNGIVLDSLFNVTLINTLAMYNSELGISLENSRNVNIINTSAIRSAQYGVSLTRTTNCTIINTAASYNDFDGIYLQSTINNTIINTTAVYNGEYGIELSETSGTTLINATTTQNYGSGISAYDTRDTIITNLAVVGNGEQGILLYNTSKMYMINVSVMHNGWRIEVVTLNGDVLSYEDPNSLPAAIVLYHSSTHVREFNVKENNVSAVKAVTSNVTVAGDMIVSNNRAIAGAAFILIQESILKLAENAHIQIKNNHAFISGGAFYIAKDLHYTIRSRLEKEIFLPINPCFFNTEGSRSQSRFTFVNNSAGKGGDILYGGHVFYGLDEDWNCLLSFKNLSNISQHGLSLITSDPSRVCLCNGTGQPDCLVVADPTPHSIYPGQSVNISAVVVGQDYGTVAGSVYAQFLQTPDGSPQLGMGEINQLVTQEKCNQLNYTIFSSGDISKGVLVLTTKNRRVSNFAKILYGFWREWILEDFYNVPDASALSFLEYGHSPLYVNFSLLPCPTGFMLTTKTPFKCDCNELLQELQGVKCYIQDQTIGRSELVWVGTLKEDNETVVTSEYCLFNNCNKGDVNVTLSEPDSQCNYNHSGTLCGGCQPGLSLALGSAQCLPCSNKYLALLIPFALAGPALVFFIKVLDLTISQGTINGLIFYANIVKANDFTFLPQGQTNPLTLFIAWLNLDLGVETCFFHGLTAYTKAWLQFVFPVYIWSIAGLIIILAKYSDRVAKVMGNNSVPVLATLFLLSYAKLFRTIIAALSYTMLYSSQGHKAVWSADGNVDYLGPKHAPLFAVAVAVLLFLWLPYTLLLFLGHWLHRCNYRLIVHTLMKMKPFLDAHYGPLKGKHHYWFGALLLVRAAILLISALIPTNHAVILNFSTSIGAVVLNYFGLIVYRNITVAMYDTFFFINLALLGLAIFFITAVGGDQTVAVYVLIGVALVQFLGLIIFKVFSVLKKCEKVVACLHKRQPAEDDWELYEQAALQREMESDTEEEDSDGSGSAESLPTY